jgi:hypothetical protein
MQQPPPKPDTRSLLKHAFAVLVAGGSSGSAPECPDDELEPTDDTETDITSHDCRDSKGSPCSPPSTTAMSTCMRSSA